MSKFYGATRFIVAEVCEPDEGGNGAFLRVKISAEIDEDHPGMRVQLLHQMFPAARAIRIARIAHLCGLMIERVTGMSERIDNGQPIGVPKNRCQTLSQINKWLG